MKSWIICVIFMFYNNIRNSEQQERIYFPDEGVISPNFPPKYKCGFVTEYLTTYSGIIKGDNEKVEYYGIYYLNTTAEKLASQGFNITVNKVDWGDVLYSFSYSNETFEKTLEFSGYGAVSPVGGEPATIARSYYMAQIGERNGDDIQWLCDGVLINDKWILTAAHCFTMPGVNPNIVRLGYYHIKESHDYKSPFDFLVRDYPIDKLIPHPEFKIDERYHDLVLIQIPRPIPKRGKNIFPICLPWDSETNRDLVGTEVTLTGWGATKYGGRKTSILQEVSLKVFPTSTCNAAYFDVLNNHLKYPKGMSEETILCVGWEEGGKDACGGDSGAPIAYRKGDHYVLAGIVSGGYGCGLREYPGLYIPINKRKYLQWIKDVAFGDYI